MDEDKILIEDFQRGDRQAFCRLYEKYVPYLLTLSMNLLADAAAAEDVVQDVFTAFVKNHRSFRLQGSLKHYLAKCTANKARDWFRRRARRRDSSLSDDAPIPAKEKDPFESAHQEEELQRIQRAMKQLPYEQREVLSLRLHGDLKFREIAKEQHVSLKTAISRYRYGLEKLRSLLNVEVTYESKR